jgi:hypothetical protein
VIGERCPALGIGLVVGAVALLERCAAVASADRLSTVAAVLSVAGFALLMVSRAAAS